MEFDAALAAQGIFRRAESKFGSDWTAAIEMGRPFSLTPAPSIQPAAARHLAIRNLLGYSHSCDPWIQAQRAGEVF